MERKNFRSKDLMRIPIFMVIASILFDDITWLPTVSGLLIIICAILEIVDTYKQRLHFINYLINVSLIILSIYMIIS